MSGLIRRQHVRDPHRESARVLRRRQTPAEQHLWARLRNGQVGGYRFRRQQPIGPYIADFYCDAAKLVVELDGPIHDTQRDYDRERDEFLVAHGLRVLRFPNDAVSRDMEALVRTIRRALNRDSSPLLAGEGCHSAEWRGEVNPA